MSNWPLLGGGSRLIGSDARPSWGGAAHTMGSWLEITASTPWAAAGLMLSGNEYDITNGAFLHEIGIGPAGSERVLVPGIYVKQIQFRPAPVTALLPLTIPRGSRLSIRGQTDRSSSGLIGPWSVGLVPASPTWPTGYQQCVALGVTYATTSLTTVLQSYLTPSYVEFSSAAPLRVRAIATLYGGVPNANTTTARIIVGAGAAGVETQAMSEVRVGSFGTTSAIAAPVFAGPFPVDIPRGSRVSAAVIGTNHPTYQHQVGLLLFG